MKSIINNKMYDTDKATKIFSYLINEPQPILFSDKVKINCWRNVDIYKTDKGQYFLYTHQGDKDGGCTNLKEKIKLVTEYDVRDIISKLDPNVYIELFGGVEEG